MRDFFCVVAIIGYNWMMGRMVGLYAVSLSIHLEGFWDRYCNVSSRKIKEGSLLDGRIEEFAIF